MGIYDRDYYREDDAGWWGDLRQSRVMLAVVALIVSTFLMELLTTGRFQGQPGRLLAATAFDSDRILAGEVWRAATSHVVHARTAFVQVALFAFALYAVGGRLETLLGGRQTAGFLVAAGAAISTAKLALAGTVDPGAVTYGAGGLVTAVVVLYACRVPADRVTVFVPLPVWLVAAGVVGLDLLGEFTATTGPGCGRVGHLAGAAFGVAYYAAADYLPGRRTPWAQARTARPRPTLKVVPDAAPVGAPPAAPAYKPRPERQTAAQLDEQLEAKLDQVLEKVARTGRESLTPDEQAILQRASEVFKRRRNS